MERKIEDLKPVGFEKRHYRQQVMNILDKISNTFSDSNIYSLYRNMTDLLFSINIENTLHDWGLYTTDSYIYYLLDVVFSEESFQEYHSVVNKISSHINKDLRNLYYKISICNDKEFNVYKRILLIEDFTTGVNLLTNSSKDNCLEMLLEILEFNLEYLQELYPNGCSTLLEDKLVKLENKGDTIKKSDIILSEATSIILNSKCNLNLDLKELVDLNTLQKLTSSDILKSEINIIVSNCSELIENSFYIPSFDIAEIISKETLCNGDTTSSPDMAFIEGGNSELWDIYKKDVKSTTLLFTLISTMDRYTGIGNYLYNKLNEYGIYLLDDLEKIIKAKLIKARKINDFRERVRECMPIFDLALGIDSSIARNSDNQSQHLYGARYNEYEGSVDLMYFYVSNLDGHLSIEVINNYEVIYDIFYNALLEYNSEAH